MKIRIIEIFKINKVTLINLRAVKVTLLTRSVPWTKLQGSKSQSDTSTEEGLGRPPSPVEHD